MDHEGFERAARFWTDREADAKRMPEAELRQEIDLFLSARKVCALACAAGDLVRCTPLEYAWRDGRFQIFSEGGLKFAALEKNPHVCLAVFGGDGGFGGLQSVQATGLACVVGPDEPAFARAAEARGIAGEALERVKGMLHLIEVSPERFDYLSSALKQRGYSARQWLEP